MCSPPLRRSSATAQLYLQQRDDTALARAKQIFALAVSGWDTDATHAAPGGVFSTQAPWSHDRNTVSNMPNAELGLRLYLITKEPYYLTWAQRMYDWTNQHLLAPTGGTGITLTCKATSKKPSGATTKACPSG